MTATTYTLPLPLELDILLYCDPDTAEPLHEGIQKAFPPRRESAFHKYGELGEPTLHITRKIRLGVNYHSQVWAGTLGFERTEAVPVLVKIFQQSLYPWPEFYDEDGINGGAWNFGVDRAKYESWACRHLASLQGEFLLFSERL